MTEQIVAPNVDHAVVIAGAGPTGMMLASELALAGVDVAVDVAVVERRIGTELVGMRAGGLHSRTIEVFDQRGIADRFLSQGKLHRGGTTFRHVVLDITTLPSRHNYFLGLWQNQIEQILANWADELGVQVYRGCEVTGLLQDEDAVQVALSDGTFLRAEYLVGCDGGRSVVRKAAGIEFPGAEPTKSWLIAEAQFTAEPAWGFREDETGAHAIAKLEDGRAMRIVLTERQRKIGGEPALDDVREAMIAVYGTDFGIHTVSSISRFTDMARQAASYRDRRVLLAGDAAHVHPPMGGQGLNIGVQDAVNLGWKLAQVVQGISRESLLDTYHTERHPVAARVLRNTMAHVALQRLDAQTKAMGDVLAELLSWDESAALRRKIAAENAGLSIHYDLGSNIVAGHPLLGHRMPDLDLVTADGAVRVFSLLHEARGVLLNFGEPGAIDIAPWSDRVRLANAIYEGSWELAGMGAIPAPMAILIRPDGYVAWVGDQTERGLMDVMAFWFGRPVTTGKSL